MYYDKLTLKKCNTTLDHLFKLKYVVLRNVVYICVKLNTCKLALPFDVGPTLYKLMLYKCFVFAG